MLEAIDLTARRGSAVLFSKLRLRVEAGRALLVTGRNGSGKTTLLRILAGLTQPSEGRVEIDGAPPLAMRSRIAFAGHAAALKDELTVEENLRALVALAGETATDASIGEALAKVELTVRRDLHARALSAGQRRRVGLARLALSPRAIWLLDEPATALDSAGLRVLADLVAQRLRSGGIVVAATHQALDLPADRTDLLNFA
ncbi:MAG: heme ABC exporter ATP-binding protein CcmA [Burkholderiales bacterium]